MQVVRLKPYVRAMAAMGLGEAEMADLEAAILASPGAHPAVPGMRGVRKVRVSRPGMGKRGGGRAVYFVSLKPDLLTMLAAYAKSDKDDLTTADRRAILRVVESLTGGRHR